MNKWLDRYQDVRQVVPISDNTSYRKPIVPISKQELFNKDKKSTIKLNNQIFANNTREKVLENRRNFYFPYETEQTKNIRNLADDQVFKSSGDLISAIHPVGAVINALYQGPDLTLPLELSRFLPSKIGARGYDNFIPGFKIVSKVIDPIQMADKLHTADSLYNSADSIDLYNQFKNGGLVSKNSLNRNVTCSNCGWSWKLSDGGLDPMTCHKCGGDIKMKEGGELDEYKDRGQVNFKDQLYQQNRPVVDNTAAPIVLPGNLFYDKTRVVNSSSAGLNKFQLKEINQNLKNNAFREKQAEIENYKAAELFHNNNPVAKLLGTRSAPASNIKPTAKELAYGLGAGINEFYDVPGIGIANDFVNPLSLVSKGIISPWMQAPLQAQQSDSYLPYVGAALSTALTVPMVRPASIAAKTFLNPKNIYTGALKTNAFLNRGIKNKKIIPETNIVEIPKNKEEAKSFTDMLSDMFFKPEEKKSFGNMVADEIETNNFVKNYNKNFKKRYKDYSDFKKEYTDFYNEQVNVFGRTPEEVDPEGIMKDFSNPDYLNDVLGYNTYPNARNQIARGLTGDYSGAYINLQLDNGGRQLLSDRGENIFKISGDDFGKYEQAKPWEVFDKNHFIRQNKYGGQLDEYEIKGEYRGQVPTSDVMQNRVPIGMQQIPTDPLTGQPLTREQISRFIPSFNTQQPVISQGTWKGNRTTKDNSFDPYSRIIEQDPQSEANIGKRMRKDFITKKVPAGVTAAAAIMAAPLAAPIVSSAMSAPLTIGSTILPYVTPATLIGAGFGLTGANNFANDLQSGYYLNPKISKSEKIFTGLTTGLDLLGTPGAVEAIGSHLIAPAYKGALKTGNYITRQTPAVNFNNTFNQKLNNTNRAISEHISGIKTGLFKDDRPFFEKFPITGFQKRKVYKAQDEALNEGVQFIDDWYYGGSQDLHPDIIKKMQEMDPNFKPGFLSDNTSRLIDKGAFGNPFLKTKNILVSTRKGALNKANISDEAKNYIIDNRGDIGGVNLKKTNESITLRNRGLYHVPPSKIKDIVIHEAGHTAQKLGKVNDLKFINWVNSPFDNIQTYDGDFTDYFFPRKYTDEGKLFDEAMTETIPHIKDSEGNIIHRGYRWESSPGELHSELLPARNKLINAYVKQGHDKKEAIDMLRSNPTDDQIDWMIDANGLNRFFKITTTPELKRKVIRMLYAGIPATIGAEALNQKQQGGPIVTNRGQWDYPGQTTIIPSNNITMQGVPYPVVGVDNTGHTKMMQPGMNYTFPGQYVTEYPMARNGYQVQPTRQDSLDVMNSQIALNRFYDNEVKNGRLKKRSQYESSNGFYIDKNLNDKNLNFYRTQIKDREEREKNGARQTGTYDDKYKNIFNLNPSDVSKLEYQGLGKTKSSNTYKKYYRDLITPMQNLASPFALFDTRIRPQHLISYSPNEYDYPGGEVSVLDYDPIVVKPADLKTKADWDYVKKNYPELYKQPVQPEPGKPVEIKKKTSPSMQSLHPQYMQSSPISMQGQPMQIQPMTLPQQKGKPVYGPGNTIIGYSNDNMKFNPAYQYTGAPNNQFNLQDKELLNNPELLKQYIYNQDSGYHYKDGGEKIPNDFNKFQEFNKTLPDNLRDDNFKYGDYSHYDLYGMWDASGKPNSFNDVKDTEQFGLQEDGTYHGFSVGNDGIWLKPKSHPSAWMEYMQGQLSTDPYFKDNHVIQREDGRLQYVPRTYKQGGGVILNTGGEQHRIYVKSTNRGEGDKGHIMVNHPTMDKGMWDTIDLTKKSGAKTIAQGVAATKEWHRENPYMKKEGGEEKLWYYPKEVNMNEGTSYYNPPTETFYINPNNNIENPEIIRQHELYHHLQNINGGLQLPQYYSGPLKKPNMMANDELQGSYYNRRVIDEKMMYDKKIKKHPDWQFIPRDIIYNPYNTSLGTHVAGTDEMMYEEPSTVEGEAYDYENYVAAGGDPMFANGGYVVRRSHDRKGKTHVVTGPDGTKKYFGDPNMGERGNSKYGKEAFYARHKSNLAKNPYFRAYARATWKEGGELNEYKDRGQVQKQVIPNNPYFVTATDSNTGSFQGDVTQSSTGPVKINGKVVGEKINPFGLKNISSLVNPYNWGVTDYTKSGTRGQAFSDARKTGEKEFIWNGNRYNTRKDTDPISYIGTNPNQKEFDSTLRKEYPEFFKTLNRGKNVGTITFEGLPKSDGTNNRGFIDPYSINANISVGENPNNKEDFIGTLIAESSHLKDPKLYKSIFNPYDWKAGIDHFRYGDPGKYYVPGTVEYHDHRLIEPGMAMIAYGNLSPDDVKRIQKHLGVEPDGYFGPDTYKAMQSKYANNKDIKNALLFHKWEFSDNDKNPISFGNDMNLAKTYLQQIELEVPLKNRERFYDVIGANKNYTDNALLSIIPGSGDYDVNKLQTTLVNKGIKLPKSTTKYGLDGVWGDETKQALEDWQKKNKMLNKKAIGGQTMMNPVIRKDNRNWLEFLKN